MTSSARHRCERATTFLSLPFAAFPRCGLLLFLCLSLTTAHCNRSARYVASEVPGARLYESRQGWNHDFMFVEMDKLLRLLLGVGPQHGPNHSDFGKM